MGYGTAVTVPRPFEATLADVREALARQGFGVLTEIDVAATMRARLGREMAPYVILGACNPTLAWEALGEEPSVGLLLPCNVVVRADGDATVVEALDPLLLVSLTGNAALARVGGEATARLGAALADVAGQRSAPAGAADTRYATRSSSVPTSP